MVTITMVKIAVVKTTLVKIIIVKKLWCKRFAKIALQIEFRVLLGHSIIRIKNYDHAIILVNYCR